MKKVNDEDSAHSSREIAKKEGMYLLYTSGACLQAIKQLNKRKVFTKTVLLLQFSVIMDQDI